ncbi:MAG: 16S rRNA (guanine(966)-N(2))-methyltransferase RsmD [Pseudomonadota bacterium]
MANNEVRIIGGQWKGRKLVFPARDGLRPTLGRVRETLFNWLVADIAGARCLDLFAGSGALGFEAASRGAAEVTFVERDRKVSAALAGNAERLGLKADVHTLPAERYLKNADALAFDIIFFDPPFADHRAQGLLPVLLDRLLAPGGLLYLEASRREPLPFPERIAKSASAGDCAFALLKRASGGTDAQP